MSAYFQCGPSIIGGFSSQPGAELPPSFQKWEESSQIMFGRNCGRIFGRTLLFYSLLNTYFELRGKLYIHWILILWTSKLIKSIFVCPKNIFFVLGCFSWKIGEHRIFFHFFFKFIFLLHIVLICVSLESLYFVL